MQAFAAQVRTLWTRAAARLPGGERTLLCLTLGLVAFTVRVAYLIGYASSPFYAVPVIDADFHHQWAQQILKGDILSLQQGDVLYKAPLYPYLLALIYKVFGVNFTVVRLIQILMGSASVSILFMIGERLFSRRVGVVASLLYALYFVAIHFDAELELPVVAIFLTLCSLLLLTGTPRTSRYAGSGALFGLSVLALPTNILLTPLWAAAAWRASSWKNAAYLLVAAGILIAPCTARNVMYGRSFVLVSANAGMNFFIGNNRDYDQTVATPPGMAWTRFNAEAYPRGSKSHVAADRYWMKRSIAEIRGNPGAWLRLLGRKVVLFLQSYEIARNRDVYYAWGESPLSRLPFVTMAVILPAALVGIAVALARREARPVLLLTLALLAAPCIMFFVASRYRLPAAPLLSLYAAYGLAWLYDAYHRRAWRQAVTATVAGALLVVFVKLNLTIQVQPAWEPHMSLGVIYRTLKKPSAAIADLRIASRMVQGSSGWVVYTRADIANKLGMLYGQVGKTDSSRAYLDTAIALVPDFDNAWFNRAVTCLQAGDNACAFGSAWNALRLGNPHPDIATLVLTSLHRALPSDTVALAAAQQVGAAATQSAILNFVAMRRAYKGDTSGAVSLLEQAFAVQPADPTTRTNLAALGRAPTDSIAPQAFAQAQASWLNLALQEAKAGKVGAALILLQQAARFGENPVVLTHLGAAWARLGNTQAAREQLQRALALQPDFTPARQMIAMVDSMQAKPTGR